MRKLRQVLAQGAFRRAQDIRRSEEVFTSGCLGPTDKQSIYWIGHSLMRECVTVDGEDISLFNLMKMFASNRGFSCDMFDHTLYGAPLSLQWRGCPHSFTRSAPEMKEKRASFPQTAARFDTFVLTEIVPVKNVIQLEFSAYYLQQFYDTIMSVNPKARVFVYESWDYLHGSASESEGGNFDWQAAMDEQRVLWERISDQASCDVALTPRIQDQVKALIRPKVVPKNRPPIFIVPVGQVFKRLHKILNDSDERKKFTLADGQELKFHDLFSNPYTNWPKSNESSSEKNCDKMYEALTLKDPDKALDDIHPSAIGIYIVALVHFATLYRTTPVGLPSIPCVGEGLAQQLQSMVWTIVCADIRSGVEATGAIN